MVRAYRRFGGTYSLQFQGAISACLRFAARLPNKLFDPWNRASHIATDNNLHTHRRENFISSVCLSAYYEVMELEILEALGKTQ
jgi:hypothetical protein